MDDQSRNLNPIPEARIAMAIWGQEYAHKQRGGSMDFWDSIGPSRQSVCRSVLVGIAKAMKSHGVTLEDLTHDKGE